MKLGEIDRVRKWRRKERERERGVKKSQKED